MRVNEQLLHWLEWEWVFDWIIYKIAIEYYELDSPVNKPDLIMAEETFYCLINTQSAGQRELLKYLINSTIDYYYDNMCCVYGDAVEFMC